MENKTKENRTETIRATLNQGFSRRGALFGGAGLFVTSCIIGGGTEAGKDAWGYLRKPVDSPTNPQVYDESAIDAVFGNIKKRSSFLPGSSHPSPEYPHFHPDDEFVADRFDELVTDVAEQRLFYGKDGIPQNLAGIVIASGSPVSNKLTRDLLQYRFLKESDQLDGLIRHPDPVFKLDFDFMLSKKELIDYGVSDMVGRTGSIANWSVVRRSSGKIFSSEVSSGKLDSDYLLVTCLPQVLRSDALSEEKIYLLGGTHGVGTKAADLLLKDAALLRALSSRIGHSQYWQALFTIEGVDHYYEDPKFGVRWHPQRLSPEFEFSTIGFDENRLGELFSPTQSQSLDIDSFPGDEGVRSI